MGRGISLEELAKLNGIAVPEEKPTQNNYTYTKKPQQKNSPRGDNRNFNNRNDKRGYGTPQTAARQSNMETATAPYNFVSLPDSPLVSEIASVADFKEHIKNCERISGEIELEIEALTPLFFGGNDNIKNSFAPVGSPIISGSSLRGMFKNIFKIVTCGTFRGRTDSQKKGEDFNDEHIYYRCIMATDKTPKWMDDLCATYKDRMEDDKGKNARPGFLIQTTDNEYFIAPLLPKIERKNDFIMILDFKENFKEKFGNVKFKDSRVKWDGEIAYILTGNQWANKPEKLLTREQYEEYRESLKGLTAEEIDKKNKELNYGKQIIRFVKLSYIDWSKRIKLPDDVLKSYEHDRNRKGVNLINYKKINPKDKNEGILNRGQLEKLCKNLPDDVKTLIPCYYLEEGGQVTAFGHGQCFRIPYKNAIGDLVPENLKSEKIIDFADAVFGSKENWASRVAFEDATPISEIETLETAAAHPLMQPNPTSYQLYLNQGGGNILTHWDKDNAKLRGYKLYWHNNQWNWKATADEKKLDEGKPPEKRVTKDLTPLKKGSKFKSKIRFENLSKIELGALLMIFDLNGAKNPAYKIGMAKSLGFGSIKINSQLYIEDIDAYTAEIFDDNGFKSPYSASNAQDYINAFKNYVNGKIGLTAWQKVMDELNAILGWENKPDSRKIAPMGNVPNERGQMDLDNRLRQRVPLPNIFEVLK